MPKPSSNLLRRTILLGAMSGMRSMSAPALIAYRAEHNPQNFQGTLFAPLTSHAGSSLLAAMSIGEFVVDKFPLLPDRIAPLPLLGRMSLGAFAGAAAFTEARRPLVLGATIGALSAAASAFVFYHLRVQTARRLHLPDPIVALGEDAVVFKIGQITLQSYNYHAI